eukprot:UN04299
MSERKLQFKPSANQEKSDHCKKSRVSVLKWGAVALWSYDLINDTCAICRNKLHDLCIDCAADAYSLQNKECTRAFGLSNHAYHWHCIARWTKTRHTCPLDHTQREYHKIE